MNNEEIMTGVELEIILKAGKILLSSGAEISRTEDTMNYIARAMNFKDLEAYVSNDPSLKHHLYLAFCSPSHFLLIFNNQLFLH